MTTLAITPNWKNKTAKFKGTVAAGEHVSVTIQNENGEGEPFIGDASTLRLRVVNPCNGRTLAIFPEPVPEGETPEEWDSDLSPLRSTLNLNTVQMLKAVPSAANVPLLFMLDDYENKTLYFKEQFPVEHWPRLRGEEEPTDLDNYKDLIAEFNARLDGFGSRITAAENAAQAATENASAAAGKANQAVDTANQAVDKAETAQNSAAASAEAAHDSALAAEKAQELAEAAAESINNPDATLAQEGVAADAKATGERIAAERTRAEAAEAAEESRAKAAESALAANVSSAQKAISDEAELRAAADADLEANKADKTAVDAETSRAQTAERDLRADVSSAQTAIANRYTKSEVDAKIAAVQTFQKYLVQTLPDPEAADYKGLYLVPTGETTPEGDLCEEWTVVGEVGSRRWEKIGGGTAVDVTLDDTVTRTSAKGVKSSGIWAAIWGALTSLPSGVASLYDWCVSQLSGKQDNLDLVYHSIPSGVRPMDKLLASMNPHVAVAIDGVTYELPLSEKVADQLLLKADAADLRYALVTPEIAPQFGFPASMFPVVFTTDGTTYTITSADDLFVDFLTDEYLLNAVVGESGGVKDAVVLCSVDSTMGQTGTPWVTSLTFNGESSTTLTVTRTATLADRAVNLITATDETSIDIELPVAVTVGGVRYARDFFLDVDNSANASDLALEFTGLGVDYAFVPPEDDSISEMMTIGSGERVRLYFTETPYHATGSLPVINVACVTLGDFVTSTATTTTQGGN